MRIERKQQSWRSNARSERGKKTGERGGGRWRDVPSSGGEEGIVREKKGVKGGGGGKIRKGWSIRGALHKRHGWRSSTWRVREERKREMEIEEG